MTDRGDRPRRAGSIGAVAGPLLLALVTLAAAPAPSGNAQPDVPETLEFPSTVGDVTFPHLAHSTDFGVECGECHHETRAPALRTPHPEYFRDLDVDCAGCHRGGVEPAEPAACSTCHPAEPTRAQEQISSAKVAIHTTCWRCHEPGTGAAASAECAFCHRSASASEAGAADTP